MPESGPCVSLDWSCHYYFRAFKQGPSDLPCYQTRRHPGWAPSCLSERSEGKETGLETGVSKARHVFAGPSRLVSPHCLAIVRDTAVSLAPAHQISGALPFLDVQMADGSCPLGWVRRKQGLLFDLCVLDSAGSNPAP